MGWEEGNEGLSVTPSCPPASSGLHPLVPAIRHRASPRNGRKQTWRCKHIVTWEETSGLQGCGAGHCQLSAERCMCTAISLRKIAASLVEFYQWNPLKHYVKSPLNIPFLDSSRYLESSQLLFSPPGKTKKYSDAVYTWNITLKTKPVVILSPT